ncbi:hypothetical protein VHUM_03607 [Vanrija humicola]|uniref:Uncharacterized protein n=1 Tax=Vanrija humicola TaxID=5417 RepID=A0A7D8V3C3_VANHU|nr:hypothetical protein VHUM_03607 [Vanrija humicola]
MSFNYNPLLDSLAPRPGAVSPGRRARPAPQIIDHTHPASPPLRSAVASSPVFIQPLPASLSIEAESRAESELELGRQRAQLARERALAEALQDERHRIERAPAKDEMGSWAAMLKKIEGAKGQPGAASTQGFARPPQAYELYQAIDKRNIDFIMRVRDHAFSLLLQKNATDFPIIYAARIGPSHRDIVVLLVGAFSRYVNQLEEDDFKRKDVQSTLKMLRANLKLAIDNALLPSQQSNLLSSYLQVLIMSEGDSWLHRSVHDLALIIRAEDARPVAQAEALVRRFSTKELRSVPGGVGDVDEYVANATLDLVIMSVWSVAAGQIGAEPLPTYTFARDLRTWTLFSEALQENRQKLPKVNSRIRKMMALLEELGGDTRQSIRGRLRHVQEALDK